MGRTDLSTIIPSLAPRSDDPALDRLLSPERHYKHPDDVLRDSALDVVKSAQSSHPGPPTPARSNPCRR